eukprot:CAMPEP_0203681358 /NCGR_PEP_ID=MMETSP0090-20130426/42496_1 /ASSEMBLY_ACC=CAM_ASM_001088 /TAXON_ID=426623 /ORGANISM="Chaetoceros affinis, Strain CCMP159" /LENGTH=50 /DNA_ID=CAMNT_0050549811 /DNA_START=23 /DNA_END=171 /DNA_ORIENTATION=+
MNLSRKETLTSQKKRLWPAMKVTAFLSIGIVLVVVLQQKYRLSSSSYDTA